MMVTHKYLELLGMPISKLYKIGHERIQIHSSIKEMN